MFTYVIPIVHLQSLDWWVYFKVEDNFVFCIDRHNYRNNQLVSSKCGGFRVQAQMIMSVMVIKSTLKLTYIAGRSAVESWHCSDDCNQLLMK